MIKIKLSLLIVVFFSLAACNKTKEKCTAKIIERKLLNDSMLQIRYIYKVADNVFEDSIKTINKNIPSDTIYILYTIQNPKEHTANFP